MDDTRRQAINPVLGRVPSGIFILTVSDGAGRETGMLCSWVQQAAFDPPAVTVAVRSDRYVNDWLQQCGQVVLNLVGEAEKQLLVHFGRGFKLDEPAFDGVDIERDDRGLPVLKDALGYLQGQARARLEAGDHTIHLIEITGAGAGEMLHEEQPMVHIRKSGAHY